MWINSFGLRVRNVKGFCEQSSEPSDFVKYWEILEWLNYS
jgi:hypothetical protein